MDPMHYLQSLRRRLPRFAVPLLLAGIALVLVLLALAWRDESPDDAIEGFVALRNAVPRNDTPFYLLGFEAAPDRDPLPVGRYRARSYALALSTGLHPAQPLPWIDPYEIERYALPEGPLFCKLADRACLDVLLAAGKELGPLLREQQVLLARYRTLLALPEGCSCQVPQTSRLDLMFPASAVLRGGRLHNLAALQAARAGDVGGALRALQGHVARLRPHLAGTDDLMAKMTYQLLVAETLEVMAAVGRRHPGAPLATVAALTPDEIDLSLPLAREYLVAKHDFAGFEAHPEWLPGIGAALGGGSRLAFKPQMTLNAVYRAVGASASASRHGAASLVATLPRLDPPPPRPALARLRNPAGEALLAEADYRFLPFVARMHDLEAKVALFNAVAQARGKVAWAAVRNPYYSQPRSPVMSADARDVCFEGPLPDEFRLRCLAL